MRRVSRQWLWLLVIVGTMGAVLYLRKSESERIQEDLKSLAAALSFHDGPPSQAWVETLRSNLKAHVADPVSVSVAPQGATTLEGSELTAAILGNATNHRALVIRLANIGVKLDASERVATAKGDALVEILEPSQERRSEPRKFSATFEKSANDWLLVGVQVGEPRIDQPEARP